MLASFFFFLGMSVSNTVGKTEPPRKTKTSMNVIANLIKFRVIKILLDCHAVILRGLQTILFTTVLWDIILMTFHIKH